MNKSFYKNSTKTAIGGIIAALSIVLAFDFGDTDTYVCHTCYCQMCIRDRGLIGRGFDTVVSPEFGLPLEKTA